MNSYVSRLIQRTFNFWQKRGVHVTLNNFLSPIPDTRTLNDSLWNKSNTLCGLDINSHEMLKLLSDFRQEYESEYNLFPAKETANPSEYHLDQIWFSAVDAEICYCMIRQLKPKRIIEIGSGFSTRISSQAIQQNKVENGDYACNFTAIEPYPTERLKEDPNLTNLILKRLEDTPLELFTELEANDILFIDSSHVLKTGSDVHRIYLEILPQLKKGVTVHSHDIFIPDEYPKEWIKNNHWFWNEQYLLKAFLLFNSAYKTLWASHYMVTRHHEDLNKTFKSITNIVDYNPSSYWMTKEN